MSERRFEFSDGKSHKFWSISVEGTSHTVSYGRVGTAGQSKTKAFDSIEKAAVAAEKLVASKMKKGYQELGSSSVATKTAPKEEESPADSTPLDRHLELVEGKTAKFWRITLDGNAHTVTYGRIGTPGQSKVKTFDSMEEALASYEKLLTQKLKKGYLEVSEPAAITQEPVTAPQAPPVEVAKTKASSPVSAAPAPTVKPGQPRVRVDELPWKEIMASRSSAKKPKLQKAQAIWKKIHKEYMKSYHKEERVPAEVRAVVELATPPEGPLTFESEKKLYEGWRSLHWVDYWLAREGPVFALDMMFLHGCLSVRNRLRGYLAGAADEVFEQALARAKEFRAMHWTSGPKNEDANVSTRMNLAVFFPNQTQWHEELVEGVTGRTALWMLTILDDHRGLQRMMEREALNKPFFKRESLLAELLPTAIERMGAQASDSLTKLVEKIQEKTYLKKAAKALCLIESPEVAEYFAKNLENKSLKEIATGYLKSVPGFALPALQSLDTSAARSLLSELQAAPATIQSPTETASSEDLPGLLLNPPWKQKGSAKKLKLKELSLSPVDFTEEIHWNPSERETLVATALRARQINRRTYEKLERSTYYDRLNPEETLVVWNEQPDDFQERSSTNWKLAYTRMAEFGMAALPGFLKQANKPGVRFRKSSFGTHPPGTFPFSESNLLCLQSPRFADRIAFLTREVSHTAKKAKNWIRENLEAAAIGMIPSVLNPEQEHRDVICEVLTEFFKKKTDLLKEVAARYSVEAEAAIEHLLSTGTPLDVPGLVPLDFEETLIEFSEHDRNWGPRLRREARQKLRDQGFYNSDRLGPEEALQYWLEPHPDFDKFAHWGPEIADIKLAEFGLESLAGHLSRGEASLLPGLERVRSPRVAPLMAHHLGSKKSAGKSADRWFWAHPEAAVHGLIPVALGPRDKARDKARSALFVLAQRGHQDTIVAVAKLFGDEALGEVEKLLAQDALLVFGKLPKMPNFWRPEQLPAPQLKNGRALPPEAVQHLGEMLLLSPPSPAYAGFAVVKQVCDRASLAKFAWEVMECWIGSGGTSGGHWTLYGLAHLGDNNTVRKLAKEIGIWQRGKHKARAKLGLEVLGLIGSDEALMHVSRYALKAVSASLREAAQEELRNVAAKRGLSLEELADRSAPTLGLDARGEFELDLGSRALKVKFNENLEPSLHCERVGILEKFPPVTKEDDKAKYEGAKTRWKELVKDAKATAGTQVARLERAMNTQRSWSPEHFTRFLAHHPLVRHLARRLVWVCYDDQDQVAATFRVAEDGGFADSKDDNFNLPDGVQVKLCHPAMVDGLNEWSQVFADYEIIQPFAQLSREVFPCVGKKRQVSLARMEGLKVPAKVLLKLNRAGWTLGNYGSEWSFDCYHKKLSACTATLHMQDGLEFTNPAASEEQTLEKVDIEGGTISDLSPVEFSELIRDLESLR